jgi:hypothetical protein
MKNSKEREVAHKELTENERLVKLISIVPPGNEEILSELKEISGDEIKKKTLEVLKKYMFTPREDWNYDAISLASGMPAEKIRNLFRLAMLKSIIDAKIQEEIDK